MKNTITTISIDEPCSQNWEQMEKRDGHNFCEACSKCVIDFSSYSNAEIIKALSSASSEVCGRLTQTQLNQLSYHLVVAPKNRNWMKYLGALTIGASVFMQNVQAATLHKPDTSIVNPAKDKNEPKTAPVNVIYGYVFTENRQPALAGIRVSIDNTSLFALTDAKGRYEIKIPKGFDFKNNSLIVENTLNKSAMKIDYSTSKQKDMTLTAYEPMVMGRIIMKKS